MALPAHLHGYSFRDYLSVEEVSTVRHEFLDGEIYAMAGGSVLHAALAGVVLGELRAQSKGRCRAFSSDLRTRVPPTGLVSYADVTVVCGPVEVDPEDADTVTNPSVIVEVLSPTTMAYDLGQKFEHYSRIASLRAVIYLWQDPHQIEVRERGADGAFVSVQSGRGERAHVRSLAIELDVDAIYREATAG
jgi:Uma2 family endonuclease